MGFIHNLKGVFVKVFVPSSSESYRPLVIHDNALIGIAKHVLSLNVDTLIFDVWNYNSSAWKDDGGWPVWRITSKLCGPPCNRTPKVEGDLSPFLGEIVRQLRGQPTASLSCLGIIINLVFNRGNWLERCAWDGNKITPGLARHE